MYIKIKATNVELTDDLKTYIEDKMNLLKKYFNNIIEVAVEVGKESEHHQKGEVFFAEVNLEVPNDLLRVRKVEETQFKAIDKVKDHMQEMLIRYKEKLRDKKGGEFLDLENLEEIEEMGEDKDLM